MPLLKIENQSTLQKIVPRPVNLERDIQNLIEKNLMEALDMDFVASEYSIQGGRMDTLALDEVGRTSKPHTQKEKASFLDENPLIGAQERT